MIVGDLDAIGRLIKFCNEWDKMRMKGDDIHGLHMGDEREAFLCASDIRQAADEIARLREERRGLVEALANLLPTKLCGEGWGLPDSETVSIVVTFGKLKAARAMIDAIGEPQP